MSRSRHVVSLACLLLLGVGVVSASAADAPPAGNVWPAHPAALYNPTSRCPQLQQASPEDAAAALILFEVSTSGRPSQASVKASSSDEKLDSAAVSCVMKLRFQPPTVLGEGTPIASTEQIAFKWAPTPTRRTEATAAAGAAGGAAAADAAAAATLGTPAASATTAGKSAAGTSAAGAAAAGTTAAASSVRGARQPAEVRVCVDETGKLAQPPTIVRSSGDAAFDAAALSVARSGSGSYRAANADGKAAAGCVGLALTPGQ
jgi:TonB family protein